MAGIWRELFITTVLPSTAVFFHGTYRGAKLVVPRNTTLKSVFAVPFFHGTSTVAFTVLFSTAIPQVPRFFDTVLVREKSANGAPAVGIRNTEFTQSFGFIASEDDNGRSRSWPKLRGHDLIKRANHTLRLIRCRLPSMEAVGVRYN